MKNTLDRALKRLPRWLTLPTAATAVGLIGIADYLTGAEISFSIFYMLPIALGAWYGGRTIGLLAAAVACVTWLAADLLADAEFSHVLIPFWNAIVRLGFFAATAIMLSEIRNRLEYEERLARTDPLTSVLNGRAFRERAEAELSRARRYGRPFSLAYLDLDNFKQVNDAHGHATGDSALQEIVDAVRGALRETDVIARLGGDELVLLLPETGGDEARSAIDRLRRSVAERVLRAGWPVTLSIGAVTFERPPTDVAEMIRLADGLMYEVKRAGKDGVAHQVYPAPQEYPPSDMHKTRPLRFSVPQGRARSRARRGG